MQQKSVKLTVEEEAAISLFFSANGGSIKFTRNIDTVIKTQPTHMGRYVCVLREREDERHGYYGQFYIVINSACFDGSVVKAISLKKELEYTIAFLAKLTELTPKKIVR